jgi:hypothetical protein
MDLFVFTGIFNQWQLIQKCKFGRLSDKTFEREYRSRRPARKFIKMHSCTIVLFVICIIASTLVADSEGQLCIKTARGCRDTRPFIGNKGRCERSRPNMKCARIGQTCRCKSSIILNAPSPFHEKKTNDGLEATLDVSLSINRPRNENQESNSETSDEEYSNSMNNLTEY